MLEPVNTVLKGIHRLSLLRDDWVLVIGQGPMGLLFTRLLRILGMNVIASDLVPRRLSLARRFGANRLVGGSLAGASALLPKGRALDAIVVTAPSDVAVQQAQQLVRGGGKVLLFAHTQRGKSCDIDLSTVCVDERDLLGSYSADLMLQKRVARLVFSHWLDVRQLITHRFPLDRISAAISLAATPKDSSLKIIVGFGAK